MSYSQYGEDERVYQQLRGHKLSDDPAILEIGAWDPKTFSNSALFIQHGWRAVLVEPSPLPLRALAIAHKDNYRVNVIAAALSLEESHLKLMSMTDDAVSTEALSPGEELWKDTVDFYGRIWVPTIRLEDIWNQFGGFDVVSIDTEGTSVDVAKRYLLSEARPRAMIVEHDGRLAELLEVAGQRNYSAIWTNGTNVILEARG